MSRFKIRLLVIVGFIVVLTILCIVFSVFYMQNRNVEGFYVLKTSQQYYLNSEEDEAKLKIPLLLININETELNKKIYLQNEKFEHQAYLTTIEDIAIIDDLSPYEFKGNVSFKLITLKVEIPIDVQSINFDKVKINENYYNIGNINIYREKFVVYDKDSHDFTYNHYTQGEIEYLEIKSDLNLSFSIKSISNSIKFQSVNNDNQTLISIMNPFEEDCFYIKKQYLIVYKVDNEDFNIMPKETRSYIEPRISKLLKIANEVVHESK